MRSHVFDSYAVGGDVGVAAEPSEFIPAGMEGPQVRSPEIMGSKIPSAGMKDKNLGDIFQDPRKDSPKTYAANAAANKRMRKFGKSSPMGPVTGGGPKGPSGPQSGQQQEQTSLGDRWLGELWQQMGPSPAGMDSPYPSNSGDLGMSQGAYPGAGYQEGGSVNSGMDVYYETLDLLDSGIGFADGGLVEASQDVAAHGRNGDTMLLHVNPEELEGLETLLGPTSVNPDTGNPEAFAWIPILVGMGIGAIAGGASDDWSTEGIIGGALLGGLTGGVGGAALAPASGAAIAGAGGAAAAGTAASTTAIPVGGALAGTPGLVWGPASGGLANVAVGGAGTAAPGAIAGGGLGGMSTAQGLNLASQGLGMVADEPTAPPPPPLPGMPDDSAPAPRTPVNMRRPSGPRRGMPGKPRSRGRIGNVLGEV